MIFCFVADEQIHEHIPSKTCWALRHVLSNFCSCFAPAHGEDVYKPIPPLCKTLPLIKIYNTDLCKFLSEIVSSASTSLLQFSWTLGLIFIYELSRSEKARQELHIHFCCVLFCKSVNEYLEYFLASKQSNFVTQSRTF